MNRSQNRDMAVQAAFQWMLQHIESRNTIHSPGNLRDGLKDTPARIVKSWREIYKGYGMDPAEILSTVFQEYCDEMVVLRDIEFYSTCEHHMLPFYGRAHIGYLPGIAKGVVGISKLARLLEVFARRLTIQERIGAQVADALMEHLKAAGAGVVLEAQHHCMTCRGIGKQNSVMVTSSMRGSFRESPDVKAEFMGMIK